MSNQQVRDELKQILGGIKEHTEAKKRLWDLFHKMKAPVVQERVVTVLDHSEADALKFDLERFKARAIAADFRAKQNEIALAAAHSLPVVDLNRLNTHLVEEILEGRHNLEEVDQEWLAFVKEHVGEPWAKHFGIQHIKPTLYLASDTLTFLQRLTAANANQARKQCRFFKLNRRCE
jgi:hypothetical protein